jgi:hypothetical protein
MNISEDYLMQSFIDNQKQKKDEIIDLTNDSYFPFLSLPRDIISEIIYILPLFSILNLAKVNKEMKNYCYSTIIWNKLWNKHFGYDIHIDFKDEVKNIFCSAFLKKCLLCKRRTTREYNIIPCFLCRTCNTNENFKTIGENDARAIYRFKDFSKIRKICTTQKFLSKRKSNGRKPTSYRIKDVENLIKSTYGEEYLKDRFQKRKERSELISNKKKIKEEKNIEFGKNEIDKIKNMDISFIEEGFKKDFNFLKLLLNEMTANGLALKKDNQYFKQYLNDDKNITFEDIIKWEKIAKNRNNELNFKNEYYYSSNIFPKESEKLKEYFEERMWNIYIDEIEKLLITYDNYL